MDNGPNGPKAKTGSNWTWKSLDGQRDSGYFFSCYFICQISGWYLYLYDVDHHHQLPSSSWLVRSNRARARRGPPEPKWAAVHLSSGCSIRNFGIRRRRLRNRSCRKPMRIRRIRRCIHCRSGRWVGPEDAVAIPAAAGWLGLPARHLLPPLPLFHHQLTVWLWFGAAFAGAPSAEWLEPASLAVPIPTRAWCHPHDHLRRTVSCKPAGKCTPWIYPFLPCQSVALGRLKHPQCCRRMLAGGTGVA